MAAQVLWLLEIVSALGSEFSLTVTGNIERNSTGSLESKEVSRTLDP